MKNSQIAIRTGRNPNHHLWDNNGTWWLHYTEHLPDYTKRRVRVSLHTRNLKVARAIRDALLTWDAPCHATARNTAPAASAMPRDAA